MLGVRRPVVALIAIVNIASAQGLSNPLLDSRGAAAGGGDTKIPVSGPGSTEVMSAESAGSTTTPTPISIEHPINPDTYVCGSGDVFELNFWGPQNFRLKIAVDLEGRTFISKVGFVSVAGKTLTAVRSAIRSKVRANYPGLQFDLTLISPRSFLVHVVGNVKHPGTYSARAIDRLSTVLAKAAPSPTASRRRIELKHRDGTVTSGDLVLYELTGDTAHDPYMLDGDIVHVPFANPVVSIGGAVRRPGSYELVKTKDLTELLDLAGGFTPSVARSRPIQIVRRNEQQQETTRQVPFSENTTPNAALSDDDTVLVSGAEELQRTIMLIGAVVGADPLDPATASKRLPFVEGDTVLSLINRAGGIKTMGDLRRSYISRPQAGGRPQLIPIDLDRLLVKRDFSADKKVAMGDTIAIPPMTYSVRVEGAVARPGLYPFNPRFSIAEYVAHAGGRSRTAKDLEEARVIDLDGMTRAYSRGLKPSPGDAIVIPERNFSRAEIVQLVLAGAGLALSAVAVGIAATR